MLEIKKNKAQHSSENAMEMSAPEEFAERLHVIEIRTRLIILCIVAFLFGACTWSYFSYMDTKLITAGVAEDGILRVYVKTEDVQKIADCALLIEDIEYTITDDMILKEPLRADYGFSDWMLSYCNMHRGEWVYPIRLDTELANGVYTAKIILNKVSIFSFILK